MDLPSYVTGNVQMKAYGIIRETVYSVLDAYQLTPTHWAMLGVVMTARDGIRQSELAEALHVKPPLITMLCQNLQQQGIIQTVTNQFDSRSKLVSISPAGKKFMKTVDAELNTAVSKLLLGMDEAALTTYYHVLETIIANKQRLDSL